MINRIYIIIGLIFLVGCSSKQNLSTAKVEPVNSEAPTGHGLYYYLPKTAIQVEVIAEKRVQKAGPFYRFAQRFLNISDVITENKVEWQIIGAQVSTTGVRDSEKLFRVVSSGTPSMAALNLTKQGVLSGINCKSTNDDLLEKVTTDEDEIIEASDINFNDVPLTQEQLIKSSTAAMAEEVAQEIYNLRDMRKDIISGEVSVGDSPEVVLAEMDKLEQAYMSLFTGRVQTQRVSRLYTYLADSEKSVNTVLLRFSSEKGFLDKMDVSGTPVYFEMEVGEVANQDFISLEDVKSSDNRGLAYNVPAPAQVRIVDRTLLLIKKEVALAQYGQLLRLPADLLDQSNVGIELDEATGALKRVFYK